MHRAVRPSQLLLVTTALLHVAAANQFYTVYYNIRLLETNKVYACLQCFKLPCVPTEIQAAPLEGAVQCCRPCTVVGEGKECCVYREHASAVCDEKHRCDTNTQVCVAKSSP